MSIEQWKFDSLEQVQELQKERKEEQLRDNKLLKEIQANNNYVRSNKDIFMEGEPKFETCSLYDPCPICSKCQNKASHLYVRCETCKIPICTHKYKDRQFMIRRENFKLNVPKEVKEHLKELGAKYEKK